MRLKLGVRRGEEDRVEQRVLNDEGVIVAEYLAGSPPRASR